MKVKATLEMEVLESTLYEKPCVLCAFRDVDNCPSHLCTQTANWNYGYLKITEVHKAKVKE